MRLVLLVCLLLLPAGVAAVGSKASSTASPVSLDAPDPGKVVRCKAGSTQRLGGWRLTFAALARRELWAFRGPGRGRFARFDIRNANGAPTVFAIRARRIDRRCRATWYRVQLPLRPNGVRGWVRARDVERHPVRTRIIVDLSSRRVSLYERGRRVLWTRAAIGTSATPTPLGAYYVNQRLIPSDPYGPFGPGAIGISAFSEVLTGWAQGGPVAIHGTNRPELIGQAVSNGCIRIHNDALRRIFARALAGTPVTVRV